MRSRQRKETKAELLGIIFTKPLYVITTLIALAVYYGVFYYLILASNKGVFLVTAPIYLIYLLIFSSALLFSVSVYSVEKALRTRYSGIEGGLLSVVTSAFGGLIVGCSCYAPIVSSILYAVGFGTLQVGTALSFLSGYQLELLLVFVALNVVFISYQLGRIIRIGK